MNVLATYFSMAKGMVGHTGSGRSKPRGAGGASAALLDASKDQVTAVFETLGVTPDGLTESDVLSRLYGHHVEPSMGS